MSLLDESGRIIVSAHKNEGGNRYEDFLNEISDRAEVLSKSNGYRVIEADRPEEIDFNPRFETHSDTADVDGIKATFRTVPGLFSEQGLDQGTRKLIENMDVNDGQEILDLGCGYGPVTAYASKMADIDAVMTDDSALAAYYAQENMDLNGIDAKVRNGDVLSEVEEEGFDRVLTNPPTHAGRDVTAEFFQAGYDVLDDDGEMFLVYNDVMGYENELQDTFSEVEVIDSSEGFNTTRAKK
jgi:16S rRNA (guanine1207-N2)-methyltransferase